MLKYLVRCWKELRDLTTGKITELTSSNYLLLTRFVGSKKVSSKDCVGVNVTMSVECVRTVMYSKRYLPNVKSTANMLNLNFREFILNNIRSLF
jgi:hypothetical protein